MKSLRKNFDEGNSSVKTNKQVSEEHKEQLEITLKNISSGKTNFRNWNDLRKFFNLS